MNLPIFLSTFRSRIGGLLILGSLLGGPLSDSAQAAFSCPHFLRPVRNLFLKKPLPKKSDTLASSPMIQLLNTSSAEDLEVIRLFTRHPEHKLLSENYIPNISDSIKESFAPWFEGLVPGAFDEMLKNQHTILTRGLDGQHPYRSTSPHSPLGSSEIGKFRYEASALRQTIPGGYLLFQVSEEMDLHHLHPALRRHLQTLSGIQEHPLEVLPISRKLRLKFEILEAITPAGDDDYFIRFQYPPGQYTRLIVQTLDQIMEKIRTIPMKASKDRLMTLLADYVQVFSVGLPFERVNFSIAMSHANYILMKHGFRGIENGELDLMAVMVPTSVFREIFRDAVLGSQPR